MRVLQLHTRYSSGLGGEDTVVDAERALLADAGHEVAQVVAPSSLAGSAGLVRNAMAAAGSIWSSAWYASIRQMVREFRPDVVHAHNLHGGLSPSALWAARREGAPVVVTLHNYRLVCPNGLLLRDGRVCRDCVGRLPWPALSKGCRWGGSRLGVVATASSEVFHSCLGTYRTRVDKIIVLTQFAREVLVGAGYPAGAICVKPNFAPVPPPSLAFARSPAAPRRFVFVGKLAPEKGVDLLLHAWQRLRATGHDATLLIVGQGELGPSVAEAAASNPSIRWAGSLPHPDTLARISEADLLVLPSRCYEGLPMVVVEALSVGMPVVVPEHGAFLEMCDRGMSIAFEPASVESLTAALGRALAASPTELLAMADAARARYWERYSPSANLGMLLDIYEGAQAARQGDQSAKRRAK